MGTVQLHEKKIFSAEFSPTRPWLLASGSLDRTVAFWDVRACTGGGKLNKPLLSLTHGLSVTAARFSADGTRVLTTCNDNLLRVFESRVAERQGDGGTWTEGELLRVAKHNNHTGRYITPFQAEWLRDSSTTFMCGSLEQPRGVDVFSCEENGGLARLENENVASVISLLACHPSLPIIASSNSSGKCFLWR